MIYTFPNTVQGESQARAVQSPKEMQWAPDGWTVRTADDMPPPPSPVEQITSLEARQTARTLRQALLGDAESIARLKAIEDEIAPLRKALSSPTQGETE